MTDDNLRVEIQKAMEARARRVEISGDNVLRGIAQLAFYDPRKLFNSDSSPKQITELDDEIAMAISGLECETKSRKPAGGLLGLMVAIEIR